jgi:hypothetical protein
VHSRRRKFRDSSQARPDVASELIHWNRSLLTNILNPVFREVATQCPPTKKPNKDREEQQPSTPIFFLEIIKVIKTRLLIFITAGFAC